MELIDFLLVVIAVLYIIRLIARIVLPRIFQNLMNKAQQQQQNYTQNTNPTGKVKVDYIPQTPKGKIPDSEGDFIDYEEIK